MTTDNSFWAGWASAEITPSIPCRMGGYGARTAPANAIHDPLYAHALVLGTRSQPFVLIICDIIAVDESMVQEVRQRGTAMFPRVTIWLGATHTHSGPDVARPLSPMAESLNPESIIAGAIQAAQEAIIRMRPVRVTWTSGAIAGVATNRDHPESSADISLEMLCFYSTDQSFVTDPGSKLAKPAAIFASFPCHPTVLGARNLAISADLPGAFRRQLQALLGDDTWVMLAKGAAGDVSTRHTRQEQSFDELERLGRLLAEQAYALILQTRSRSSQEVFLKVSMPVIRNTTVELETKKALSPDLLKEYTHTLREQMQQELQAGNVAQARTLETALQGLESAQQHAFARVERTRQVEIAVATMGEPALVAIPGELYNRLGAQLRRESRRPLLLLGYTNGYVGYLPTREAYAEIDYEVLVSPFAPGSAERLRDAIRMLLTQQDS